MVPGPENITGVLSKSVKAEGCWLSQVVVAPHTWTALETVP